MRLYVSPATQTNLISVMFMPYPKQRLRLSLKQLYLLVVSAPKDEGCEVRPIFPGEYIQLIQILYISRTSVDLITKPYLLLLVFIGSHLILFFQYNQLLFMKKRTTRTLTATETTSAARSTIESVLSRGADKLYDRYITTKIPVHMSNDFDKTIHNIFKPIQKSKGQQKSTINTVHESLIEKVHVIDEKHRPKSSFLSKAEFNFKMPKTLKNSIELKHKSQQTRGSSRRTVRNVISPDKTQEKQFKEFLSSQLTEYPQKICLEEEITSEDQLMWVQKQKRDLIKQNKEKEALQEYQKNMNIRRRLQEQIRQLQHAKRAIPFDYETGRLIENSEKHIFEAVQSKKNIIYLNYDFEEKQENIIHHPPTISLVSSTRKITNFTRPKKKKIIIDQDLNDRDYNNNGKRQNSLVPFLQISEGVQLKEEDRNVTEHKERTNAKIQSASTTHRTFKSYSKEMMEQNRFSKTICVSSEKQPRYSAQKNEKLINQSSLFIQKNSILWKNPNTIKNHKITSNFELVKDYFQFKEKQVQ